MSSLEERVSWTRDAVLERSRPRVAQRETYSRRSGSRPPFVDVALSALRSDLHDPLSEQAMKSNMAGELVAQPVGITAHTIVRQLVSVVKVSIGSVRRRTLLNTLSMALVLRI